MNKAKINYVVDFLAFIAFIVVAVSGLVIYFFLPDGVRQGGYQEFWGLTKHVWSNMHDVWGIAFIILMLIHFILHLNWVICMTKSFFLKKTKKEEFKNE